MRGRQKGSRLVNGKVVKPQGDMRLRLLGTLDREIQELESSLAQLKRAREALAGVL